MSRMELSSTKSRRMLPLPEPVFTLTMYVVPETGVTPMMEAPVMPGSVVSAKSLKGGRMSTPVTDSEKCDREIHAGSIGGICIGAQDR